MTETTVPGLLSGETAYQVELSGPEDTTLQVVRVSQTPDPSVVAGEPVTVLRVDAYEVDSSGLVIDGGSGLSGPPVLYADPTPVLRAEADPAAALATLIEGLRGDAVESARRYLLATRALAALPAGSDLPL
jgi:hypothetical protein